MAALPPPQCAALQRALDSFGRSDLLSLSSTLEACCAWPNRIVVCNDRFRITELRLVNMGLSGAIPSALGQLTDLEFLDLSVNSLVGTLPNELGNLRNLRELHLVGSPDAVSSRLSGELPPVLKSFTMLEKINLSNNDFTGSLQALSNLDTLVELRIVGNKLDRPIDLPWGTFRKLEILHLNHNRLTGNIPENLAEASNLEELELEYNNLLGNIPESLSKLKSLSTLKLNNNKFNNGTLPKLPPVKNECTLIAESSGNAEGNLFTCKSPNLTQTELDSNTCLKDLPRTITVSDLPTCAPPPPPKAEAPPAAPSPSPPAIEPSGGLPTVAIVGIVVGVLALLAVAVFAVMRRHRRANKKRDLDATMVETKPTPQQSVFRASIADNPPRMSVIVDAHGNRHSIHLPSHVADGSQFILVQQPPPQPTAHAFAPAPEHHAYAPDMRLMRQSITSDPSSLASSTQHQQQPMFIMHPNAAPSANGPSVHSVPMPPVPPVFLPNELVYLGDNPRASMSTVATATTVATEAGAPTAADQVQESKEPAKSAVDSDVPPAPPVPAPVVSECVVREAVPDRPVSMVTVNQPMYIMHPNAPQSANGSPVHSVPMPPVPPVFLLNELVYLGDNPRSSMSTVATATTVANEAGAPAGADGAKQETVADGAKQDTDMEGAKQDTDVKGAKQGQEVAEAAKSVAVSPTPRVPVASEGVVREAVVREAVPDQPVSMVTVNVPDGYTVSLVPISRPQTPAVAGRELGSASASSQSGV